MQGSKITSRCLLPLVGALVLADEMSASAGYAILPVRDSIEYSVVTADRDRKRNSTSPLQIVGRKDIERMGAVHMHEAIRTLAGTNIRDYGGIGGLKTVSIRNLGANHTTIAYDGFAVTDAQNGQVDISGFMLENVSELSVTSGPTDEIFCNARQLASSAAVNITTQQTDRKFAVSAGLNVGSYNTWNPYIHIEGSPGNRIGLTADANYLTSKGNYPFILVNGDTFSKEKRTNSDVNIINSEINFNANTPINNGKFSFKANYNQSERGLPGPVILYYSQPSERLWDKKAALYSKYKWNWGTGWKTEVAASYNYLYNKYINNNKITNSTEVNRYIQQEGYVSAILGYQHKNWKFTVAEDVFVNILDSNIPECPFPTRLSSITGLAGQYQGNRLKITAILTFFHSNEWLRKPSEDTDVADNLSRLSPSLAVSYSLLRDKNLKIRAYIKDGHRVPTFNDLYYSRVGNTSLVPEKALLTNFGLTWNRDSDKFKIFGSLDVYYNRIKDKISATPTLFIWKMRNIGRVNIIGTEVSASMMWKISDKAAFHANGNYSFQYAVDVTDRGAKTWKQQIPYVPRHCGNFNASIETKWITITYTMIGVGIRYALPQNTKQNHIDSYTDHCLCLSRSFDLKKCKLRLAAEGLNLAGDNYQIIKGYPMPGRAFRINLKFIY